MGGCVLIENDEVLESELKLCLGDFEVGEINLILIWFFRWRLGILLFFMLIVGSCVFNGYWGFGVWGF